MVTLVATGAERSVDALRERLRRTRWAADLHELRLDFLDRPGVPVDEIVAGTVPLENVVVTCRPEREFGRFPDALERDRLDLLRRAGELGVGFVDVEAAAELPEWPGRSRLVRSAHVPDCAPATLREAIAGLSRAFGDVWKLAAVVRDRDDLVVLRAASARLNWRLHVARGRTVVVVGLGPFGGPTRFSPETYGSAWAFAAAGPPTTHGQPTIGELRAFGFGPGGDRRRFR